MTPQDKQILERTSWIRCLIFLGIWFSFLIITHVPVFLLLNEPSVSTAADFSQISARPFFRITLQFCSVITVLAAVFIMRKYIEKESVIFPYLKPDFNGFIKGSLLAFGMMASLSLILSASGLVAFSLSATFAGLFPYFVLYMLLAIHEEILCRDYLLNMLNRAHGRYIAIIVSSLIFTSFHLLNRHISWLGLLSIFLGGVVMALFFLKNKNLWAPVGIHFAWNFAQGPLFGFAVSGHQNSGLFQAKLISHNTFLTGGAFGLEGSLLSVIALTIAILLFTGFHFRNRRRGTSFLQKEDLNATTQ